MPGQYWSISKRAIERAAPGLSIMLARSSSSRAGTNPCGIGPTLYDNQVCK
jgi:hypothetical protein